MQAIDARGEIRERALALGFDAVGFAAATAPGEAGARLAAFLAAGMHGDMGWMATTAERRAAPRAIWPQARSVVALGLSYAPDGDPLAALARRCISYLTIEHAGPIPRELREAIGNRIYGCDDCLAVCPWNKFAVAGREAKLAPRPELDAPKLATLAALDDAGFRALFRGTPVKRTGRDRFVRNVLIAVGNSGDPALIATAEALLDDASALVRGAAVWALARLLAPPRFAALRAAREGGEPDADVRVEWAAA